LIAIGLGDVDFIVSIKRCVKEGPNDINLLTFKVLDGYKKQEHLNTGVVSDGSIKILILPVLVISADYPASSIANPFVF
jgi:hypothetical protein